MRSVYKLFPAMLLALSAVFHTTAQTITWEALNGPSGVYALESLGSDADGRLFMYMNNKIYRSTDQGDSWLETMTGLPAGLGRLVRFLRGPSGVFYAHFEVSIGGKLFRFVPAGNSWSEIPLPFGPYDLDGIDFDTQGRLWASTDESQSILQYSTNGGQTFQKVTTSGQIQGWFDFLATYNDAHNLIAVSYGAGQKVYHFTITGAVTQVISGRPVYYLGYNPNTGTAFYSDLDGCKRSTDGGLTWLTMPLPQAPSYTRIYDMFFEPGGRIWAQANQTVYFSDDDGATWFHNTTLGAMPGTYYRATSGNWFVTNNCSAPSFSRTKDMGATWTDLSGQFRIPQVEAIRKDAAANLYAQTCRSGAYEKSTDGGQRWADLIISDGGPVLVKNLATRPDGFIIAIHANDKL